MMNKVAQFYRELVATLTERLRNGERDIDALVEQAQQQGIPAAELLDPLLMAMDSPASDYPVVNLPLTSSVYFKNGNPVRTNGAPLDGLVRVTEGDEGKFLGMGEIDDEGRVAPRRLVVEYPE